MDKPADAPVAQKTRGASGTEGLSAQELRYPSVPFLRDGARRRVPRFAFDFMHGGCGEDRAKARNRAALDAIEIMPRYGLGTFPVSTTVELFGRRYAAPLGMAPMGVAGLTWPKMEEYLAAAAQAANVPYVLATPASAHIERIAAIAPDVFWFQTYAAKLDDYRVTFDMLRRAERANARALLVTIDSPVRAKRPRDARNRLSVPFKPNLPTLLDLACHPRWLLEVLRHGTPRSENFVAYVDKPRPSANEVNLFVQKALAGGYDWDTIRRLRDVWPRALVIKGVLHPADVEMAARVGADGIVVSNHGGRTFDAAPAAVDLLPLLRSVAGDMTVLFDSGIRSGLDAVRALAVGAHAVFAGRAFQYGVGAMGPPGAAHVLGLLLEEIRQSMGQVGAANLAELAGLDVLHPAASRYAHLGKPASLP